MCSTLDQVTVQIEKPVRHPVERPTGMWTAVAISRNTTVLANQEDILADIPARERETAAAAFRKISKTTYFSDGFVHGVYSTSGNRTAPRLAIKAADYKPSLTTLKPRSSSRASAGRMSRLALRNWSAELL